MLSTHFLPLSLRALVGEFEAVRRSHLWLFRNLPGEAWVRRGEADGKAVSVRALAYVIAGHARHHTAILRRRRWLNRGLGRGGKGATS